MTGNEFDKLVAPIRDLIAKKGEDYNHAVQLHEYFPFGRMSYVQMCYMKAMRMRSLVQQTTVPNFDSLKDTVQDEIAYAVFFLDFLEKEAAKQGALPSIPPMPSIRPAVQSAIHERYQEEPK